MSYKTELQGNNTDLQNILNAVNALPDTPSITATDDGDGNVTLKMNSVSSTYRNGDVTLEQEV